MTSESVDPPGEDSDEPVLTGRLLGKKLFVGSLFLFFSGWSASVVNFTIGVAIARLLGPEAIGFFGLMISIGAVIDILGAVSPGLGVVQARRATVALYDTGIAVAFGLAFAGMLITGLLIPIILALVSKTAVLFLGGLAIARFFSFMSQIPNAHLERSFRYRSVAAITFIGSSLPNLVALAFAWLGAGAWSLLLREVLQGVLIFGLGIYLSGYRFRGEVSREAGAEIMSFGRPLFFSRSVEIVLERVDRLAIGLSFGDATLGLYNQSRFLSETGLTATRPLGRLSFNLYSRLREDRQRLRKAYGIVNFFLARVVFAGALSLLVFPAETIRLLLGEEWIAAAPILRWLSGYGALLPVFENMKTLLYGRGNVQAAVILRLVQLIVMAIGVTISMITGEMIITAISLLGITLLGVLLTMWWNRDVVAAEWTETFSTPLVCGVVVASGFMLAPLPLSFEVAPWWMKPILPSLAFSVVLIVMERKKLLVNLDYLRHVARMP